jgi:hypothetical protein
VFACLEQGVFKPVDQAHSGGLGCHQPTRRGVDANSCSIIRRSCSPPLCCERPGRVDDDISRIGEIARQCGWSCRSEWMSSHAGKQNTDETGGVRALEEGVWGRSL